MKNVLMNFIIIIVTVTINNVIANNHLDLMILAKAKNNISQIKMQLNLTEDDKESIVKVFEGTQKKLLQKFLDNEIKPNLPEIKEIIKKSFVIEQEDFWNNPIIKDDLKKLSINAHEREWELFVLNFMENNISERKQCILNENNSIDFCNECTKMLFLLNAEHAINEIGRDVFNQIETNIDFDTFK